MPAQKRPKFSIEQTPLRDQMRLNQDVLGGQEAWERSSIASGFTSVNNGVPRVDIRKCLSSLPAPNQKNLDSIRQEQLALLQASVDMQETETKARQDKENEDIDREEKMKREREMEQK